LDITKRKRDEEKLIQAEKRHRTVADFTYDLEYWKSPDGTFLYVSPSCERITGYKPEEFINNPEFFRELILPEDKTRWDKHHQKALKEKGLQEIQFRIHKQDGQTRWIEHMCQPVIDKEGEFLGFRASNRDITQRKKIETEINRLREEYLHIARVAAIGELAASLAHELKQPLAAIRSNAQAAQRFLTGEKPDLDEFHAILTDIIKDNRRADEVIGRLRTLMRKEKLQITKLNINELIQELFPLIHSYEIMRDISLEFEPDDRLPFVVADRVQLQQVILNLLLNSSEALMDVSGDMRKITIQVSQKDTHNITVAIKDNGPGIDEQNIDHLFEPFYTTKKEGLGMGLAISRSIIEAHRGSLWAENNSDNGVTFYFTLPVFKRSSV
jgi:PAS domain S-box-containing protein